MKKLTIFSDEVEAWMESSYQEYAAETYRGSRLRLRINFHGNCKVTHGMKVLFAGKSIASAVRAFNLCEKP